MSTTIPREATPPPPRTMNGRKALSNVTIRRFGQPGDLETVQKTYIAAMMEGRDSPFQTGMRRFSFPYRGLFGLFAGFVALGAAKLLTNHASSPLLEILPPHISIYITPNALKRVGQVVIAATTLCGSYVFYARQLLSFAMNGMVKQVINDDLKDITASYKLDRKPASDVEESKKDVSCFWVAELDGTVVGAVGIYPSKKVLNMGEVRRLFVHPSYQGRGIAGRLMSKLTEHARAHGLEGLHLSTSEFNSSAVEMYHRTGWELEKRVKMWYFGLAASIVYMRKSIL